MHCSLGISTCPNDIFTFYGLLSGAVTCPGLDFDIQLLDVQELNELVAKDALDISKVSFAAAVAHASRYAVLSAGSALGYGVGPLLLRRRASPEGGPPELGRGARVLCPGAGTTAGLLFKYFFPQAKGEVANVLFSEIMPALEAGAADYGVVIHEGRFTYRECGLELVADLGSLWEGRMGLPLPLGGIVGRKALGYERLAAVSRAVRQSLEFAYANREDAFQTMQQYAQELAPEVIWGHVELYVNQWSGALGEQGRAALATFEGVAREGFGIATDGDLLQVIEEA
jgi:1,4-dihydroxy-6-naphthoate synthase